VFSAIAQPGHTNEVLSTAHYDVAELVFRQYMPPDSKTVDCLTYGTNYSPFPKGFLSRFKAQTPIVRGQPDAITVVSNQFVLDKITRKEAVGFDIREIRVAGDTTEVLVNYFASFTGNSTRFYLVRENGKWRVKETKVESISCG
jgi:hypothetical protein